jgi:hypothetical protein
MLKRLLLFPLLTLVGCAATPEPKFDLLGKSNDFEVRHYHPRIIAQTTVEASYEEAPNIGFRRLADYIFGNNTTAAAIEMTAPVGVAPAPAKPGNAQIEMTAPVTIAANNSNAAQYVITFTMPENYTLATLPKPKNSQVTISELAPRTYAAVRFSGFTDVENVQAKTKELRDFIKSAKLIPIDPGTGAVPVVARYDPPWTLPMFRRNEILIEIQDPGTELKLPAAEGASH